MPRPPPGDLPNPGMEPVSLLFPALAGGFFMEKFWETAHSKAGSPGEKPAETLLSKFWALFWGLSSAQTKPEERLCPHGADMPTVGGRLPRAPWGAPPALSSGGIRSSAGSRDRVRGLVHHHQNSGFYLERVGRPHPAKQRGAPRAAAWRTP